MAETKDISANPTQRQTQIDDRYDPHRIEEKWHARWQAEPRVVRRGYGRQLAQKVLRPGNAALSLRRAPHGTRPQLCHWGCARALHVDAGL